MNYYSIIKVYLNYSVTNTIVHIKHYSSSVGAIMDEESIAVADLINQLFDRHRRADGKEYTNHEISKATAGKLSPTYLAKLRSGEIPNPGRYRLMLLCKFFHVPASYFFPELDAFEPEDEVSPEDQLRAAFRTMGVPTDIQAHLVAVAQAFKQDKEKGESNE